MLFITNEIIERCYFKKIKPFSQPPLLIHLLEATNIKSLVYILPFLFLRNICKDTQKHTHRICLYILQKWGYKKHYIDLTCTLSFSPHCKPTETEILL